MCCATHQNLVSACQVGWLTEQLGLWHCQHTGLLSNQNCVVQLSISTIGWRKEIPPLQERIYVWLVFVMLKGGVGDLYLLYHIAKLSKMCNGLKLFRETIWILIWDTDWEFVLNMQWSISIKNNQCYMYWIVFITKHFISCNNNYSRINNLDNTMRKITQYNSVSSWTDSTKNEMKSEWVKSILPTFSMMGDPGLSSNTPDILSGSNSGLG